MDSPLLATYDYTLPPELIATAPASPRDSAKLLVFNPVTGETTFDTFRRIIDYLPKDAVLVFNETKVIPARMQLRKQTGGMIGALYLHTKESAICTLAEGKLQPGDVLTWQDNHTFTVLERSGKEALLQPSFKTETLPTLLERFGETPLPPYIKESPLTEAERRSAYQTVYAETRGSVAAPTAGLHFTQELCDRIRAAGIRTHTITLHVGLGTFAPLDEEQLRTKKLHKEWYAIHKETAEALEEAKRRRKPIIAVGTTVVRTLEAATDHGTFTRLQGETDLFLSEDNPPRFIDGMITNFHVPRSSLMMLVASLVGRDRLLDLYRQAIDRRMRFFSFGDGMLLLPQKKP